MVRDVFVMYLDSHMYCFAAEIRYLRTHIAHATQTNMYKTRQNIQQNYLYWDESEFIYSRL